MARETSPVNCTLRKITTKGVKKMMIVETLRLAETGNVSIPVQAEATHATSLLNVTQPTTSTSVAAYLGLKKISLVTAFRSERESATMTPSVRTTGPASNTIVRTLA